MSQSFRTLKNIEREAKDGKDAYELIIGLRSGRVIEGSPYAVEGTTALKFDEKITSKAGTTHRITYIEYDAIEQVTPIWL
ncbi:hypothetical protein NKI86_31525 [Mesorhizobium sp. M0320]|uniref:hypothetical protein n=1 Tax=unclassified Mesorhizobium TaxID=325217 RepID=UPI00333C22BC